jgi:hypothetical protein
MATITGVWEWRIVGGGEDRRHINTFIALLISVINSVSISMYIPTSGPLLSPSQVTSHILIT